MNCFFSDEVANFLDFIKGKKLNLAEVTVKGDCFGLLNYVSEVENRRNNDTSEKAVIYTLDFTEGKTYNAADFFANVGNYSQYLFVSLFDFEKAIPSDVTALSEREVSALAEYDNSFKSVKAMVDFENSLKPYAEKYNIKVLRYTNIYGAEINSTSEICKIITDFRNSNRVELSEADFSRNISLSYISAVLRDIYSVIAFGKKGNIYNGSNMQFTVADIKNSLYKSCGGQLFFVNDETSEKSYKAITCHKIKSLTGENAFCLDESLLKAVTDSEEVYIENYLKKSYDGKVQKIREKETEILSEVDRICKKHNIDYYLVGGSLLGAVRNQGFIPWDDDVDICMLRDDFEKFRKICPEELNDAYAYQSYRDEKSTHYIYDKIRLKGTYFSSEHSNKYDDMENGIFLDVFVFDKTANSKMLQKHFLQFQILNLMYLIIRNHAIEMLILY